MFNYTGKTQFNSITSYIMQENFYIQSGIYLTLNTENEMGYSDNYIWNIF